MLLDRNWRWMREQMSGEVHVQLSTGTIADLHWHLFSREESRRYLPVRTGDVLSRAIVVELDGVPTRTLSDEDTLVHLALHACLSGGTRLLWCKDLEQAVIYRAVNWDAVVDRALEWHAGPPTALMLGAASRALEFPVPDDVLGRLSPGVLWRGLTRMADRWSPPERWSGGRSIRRDLCLTSRSDDLTSAVALLRRAGSLVKKRDRGAPRQPDRLSSRSASRPLLETESRDRAAYFAALEARPGLG